MKWVTREHVHFDRVASPWLIKRFIDKDAEFFFVPWGKEDQRPAGAIPFAIPGVELGYHDTAGTTFHKIMVKYNKFDDPGLAAIDQIITNGVENTMHKVDYPSDRLGELTPGVQALVEGVLLLSKTDQEQLDKTFPVYDALYAMVQMENLLKTRGEEQPKGVGQAMWRTVFSMALAMFLRPRGKIFSTVAIQELNTEFESDLTRLRSGHVTADH
jgi:hypothetical protein